ncbi:MAG: LCP family protein [Christensenellaceae bacterium]|jgi:LCP family protein required for cell wall assembly|nr:LCP family protein [Christensenellaceae bacterium]
MEEQAPTQQHPKQNKKHKKKRMRPASIIVLCVVLALVIAGAAWGINFYHDILSPASLFENEPTAPPTPTPVATLAPTAAPPTPTPTPDPDAVLQGEADLDFMQNRVNILVLGIDESAERESWGSFRTDTIMLVTIDFATYDVNIISVPRDSYVKIYTGEGELKDELTPFNKINAAFSAGGGAQKKGFDYTRVTVSKLLGVPINYYLGFNMNVVKQVVDAMGGVDYEVDTEVTMNGRELHPGLQHLDGQAVLDYCRQRKGSSDIARVDRQQRMVTAIVQQLKDSQQIANIPSIYTAVEQNIMTNLSFKQICSLSLVALRMDMSQLGRHTVEGKAFSNNGRDYWGVYAERLQSLIKDVFGANVSIDEDVDVSRILEQIELSRQLVATELNAAYAAYTQGKGLLADYGSYIDGETKQTLKAYLDALDDAMDSLDKALLDAYTPVVQQLNAQIIQALNNMAAQQY